MKQNKKSVRICLWSGPRNISTALMYSFAQRSDCKVYDEPLYAHYLSRVSPELKSRHPEADLILETMENNGSKVVDMMMGEHGTAEVVFFKNMTHHLPGIDREFMSDVVNVILTRDPEDMLPSFDKVISSPSITDVGYEAHLELYDYLTSRGIEPVVLESKRMQENPRAELSRLCKAAGIEFDEAMLSWEAGPRSEDGVWAKHWYTGTHRSTGFQKYTPKTTPFPNHLKPLLAECKPYYNKLMSTLS